MIEYQRAAELIIKAKHAIAFTGAGISVESGIPPFRGSKGLWNKYDPKVLDLDFFHEHPEKSWPVIKEIFYDFFDASKPNYAHLALADLEKRGFLKTVITQNIDNLHIEAGSNDVIEFHGNSHKLICENCSSKYEVSQISLERVPVLCKKCNSVLKPDFIFFGEGIPSDAYQKSMYHSENADLVIIVGTSGEVKPAAYIPEIAKQNGAQIIEINREPSLFTNYITDFFFKEKASLVFKKILEYIDKKTL